MRSKQRIAALSLLFLLVAPFVLFTVAPCAPLDDQGLFVGVDNDSGEPVFGVVLEYAGGAINFGDLKSGRTFADFVESKRVQLNSNGSELRLSYTDAHHVTRVATHAVDYAPNWAGRIVARIVALDDVQWDGSFRSTQGITPPRSRGHD